MYAIFIILLIPIIIFFLMVLFAGVFAYAKLRQLWYSITGRKPRSSGFTFHSSSSAGSAQGSSRNYQSGANEGTNKKKIFSKDDGEYVDFEEVQ